MDEEGSRGNWKTHIDSPRELIKIRGVLRVSSWDDFILPSKRKFRNVILSSLFL